MTARRALLRAVVREEWRRHARLFGGPRFALFPVLIALLGAGAIWGLTRVDTRIDAVVQGVLALSLILGLYTGSAGLTGRDALRGLLGDVTLLMATLGTLPISLRSALSVFLVSEVAYYTGLFLAPITVAFALGGAVSLGTLPVLLAAVVGAFVLGLAITLVLLGASQRGRVGMGAVFAVGLGIGGLWFVEPGVARVTPFAIYVDPTGWPALASVASTLLLAGIGALVVDPTREPPPRHAVDRFAAVRRRLDDRQGLLTKTLLDVHRSDGGLWKIPFSGAILFVVAALLVGGVETITGVAPSVGVAVGTLLGLSAFTTFNWLTQFDSVETYAAMPVSTPAVFAAKFRGFVILGVPTILAFVGLAAVLFRPRALDIVVGAVLALGIGTYLVGLTTLLTGLRPGSFLFDPLRYAAFTAAVAVVLVPILIVGFVLVPINTTVLLGLGVVGVGAGVAGWVLYRLAIPRWTRRYRTAEV